MTSSQWLDIAIVGVAFIAALSGWRSGALGSLLSFIGVVLAVLCMQFLSSGLNMLGVSNFARELIWGVLLLLVMVVNAGTWPRLRARPRAAAAPSLQPAPGTETS